MNVKNDLLHYYEVFQFKNCPKSFTLLTLRFVHKTGDPGLLFVGAGHGGGQAGAAGAPFCPQGGGGLALQQDSDACVRCKNMCNPFSGGRFLLICNQIL